MMDFRNRILDVRAEPLTVGLIDVLQVNPGSRCNMSCRHCHFAAGLGMAPEIGRENVEAVLQVKTCGTWCRIHISLSFQQQKGFSNLTRGHYDSSYTRAVYPAC
jgi:hypothetical protein